jgi:hypothetical protein
MNVADVLRLLLELDQQMVSHRPSHFGQAAEIVATLADGIDPDILRDSHLLDGWVAVDLKTVRKPISRELKQPTLAMAGEIDQLRDDLDAVLNLVVRPFRGKWEASNGPRTVEKYLTRAVAVMKTLEAARKLAKEEAAGLGVGPPTVTPEREPDAVQPDWREGLESAISRRIVGPGTASHIRAAFAEVDRLKRELSALEADDQMRYKTKSERCNRLETEITLERVGRTEAEKDRDRLKAEDGQYERMMAAIDGKALDYFRDSGNPMPFGTCFGEAASCLLDEIGRIKGELESERNDADAARSKLAEATKAGSAYWHERDTMNSLVIENQRLARELEVKRPKVTSLASVEHLHITGVSPPGKPCLECKSTATTSVPASPAHSRCFTCGNAWDEQAAPIDPDAPRRFRYRSRSPERPDWIYGVYFPSRQQGQYRIEDRWTTSYERGVGLPEKCDLEWLDPAPSAKEVKP